jgi:hypothetical protein
MRWAEGKWAWGERRAFCLLPGAFGTGCLSIKRHARTLEGAPLPLPLSSRLSHLDFGVVSTGRTLLRDGRTSSMQTNIPNYVPYPFSLARVGKGILTRNWLTIQVWARLLVDIEQLFDEHN